MKILIIRFSSFGDVLQCLSVAGALAQRFPEAEIHWVTREEFVPLVKTSPSIHKVWSLGARRNARSLWRLALELRSARFTHVYDAHNNLRSRVIGWVVRAPFRFLSVHFLRRSIFRFRRFLLFRFRINLFPQPFSGQRALLEPLRRWDVPIEAPPPPQLWISPDARHAVLRKFPDLQKPFVALAPSAAFELKRWPVEYWKELILGAASTRFVLLGGPQDHFLSDLEAVAPDRVRNLAGQLSLEESAAVVETSRALVSNDTGLMHVAEQIGKPCVALMGPAPFGYPSRPLTTILEIDLPCRPCSKHGQGPCVNPIYQKCLRDIRPETVLARLRALDRSPAEVSQA